MAANIILTDRLIRRSEWATREAIPSQEHSKWFRVTNSFLRSSIWCGWWTFPILLLTMVLAEGGLSALPPLCPAIQCFPSLVLTICHNNYENSSTLHRQWNEHLFKLTIPSPYVSSRCDIQTLITKHVWLISRSTHRYCYLRRSRWCFRSIKERGISPPPLPPSVSPLLGWKQIWTYATKLRKHLNGESGCGLNQPSLIMF